MCRVCKNYFEAFDQSGVVGHGPTGVNIAQDLLWKAILEIVKRFSRHRILPVWDYFEMCTYTCVYRENHESSLFTYNLSRASHCACFVATSVLFAGENTYISRLGG